MAKLLEIGVAEALHKQTKRMSQRSVSTKIRPFRTNISLMHQLILRFNSTMEDRRGEAEADREESFFRQVLRRLLRSYNFKVVSKRKVMVAR